MNEKNKEAAMTVAKSGAKKTATSASKKARKGAGNLVPNSQRTPDELREITRKGGIKSGEVRREKRDRKKQMQMIFDLTAKDPKSVERLDQYGIDASKRNLETAMDISMALKVIDEGNPAAYRTLKEEAYGKIEGHDSLDINAEVTGITFSVKKYRK